MKGYIPAWRRIFDPDHHLAPSKRDPASRLHAWLDLCAHATHQTYQRRDIVLQRGEFIASLRYLARRWHWSLARVERFINDLKARTQIETVRETLDGTVYRIVKYDTYAVFHTEERDAPRDANRDTSETPPRQKQTQENTEITNTIGGSFTKNELLEVANEVLGRRVLNNAEKSRNNSILVSWLGTGRTPDAINAAIRGLALMVERRANEVADWLKPGQPIGLRALHNTSTLYDQGDGKAKRVLFDVALEEFYRGNHNDERRVAGWQKISV